MANIKPKETPKNKSSAWDSEYLVAIITVLINYNSSVNLDMWKGLISILLISLALTVHIGGVFRILSNI